MTGRDEIIGMIEVEIIEEEISEEEEEAEETIETEDTAEEIETTIGETEMREETIEDTTGIEMTEVTEEIGDQSEMIEAIEATDTTEMIETIEVTDMKETIEVIGVTGMIETIEATDTIETIEVIEVTGMIEMTGITIEVTEDPIETMTEISTGDPETKETGTKKDQSIREGLNPGIESQSSSSRSMSSVPEKTTSASSPRYFDSLFRFNPWKWLREERTWSGVYWVTPLVSSMPFSQSQSTFQQETQLLFSELKPELSENTLKFRLVLMEESTEPERKLVM